MVVIIVIVSVLCRCRPAERHGCGEYQSDSENCSYSKSFHRVLRALDLRVAASANPSRNFLSRRKTLYFSADHVRVLDFRVKPGEKVGMHSHRAASIAYYLTDAKVKYTDPDDR